MAMRIDWDFGKDEATTLEDVQDMQDRLLPNGVYPDDTDDCKECRAVYRAALNSLYETLRNDLPVFEPLVRLFCSSGVLTFTYAPTSTVNRRIPLRNLPILDAGRLRNPLSFRWNTPL